MNIISIVDSFSGQVSKSQKLSALFRRIARVASPERVIVLDYPINSKPRWDQEHPHRKIYDIINANRNAYKAQLSSFLAYTDQFSAIPERQQPDADPSEPCWLSGWMPALDKIALYGFIAAKRPKYYFEVGSGNSTKIARRAIRDHNLDTQIISIDPCPRAEVDRICDKVIRKPVEEVDVEFFDCLQANDILYIDNSHRVFMNSDATAIFLDVMPRLKPGVFLEIHDVTLPYDYPEEYIDRHYSEQYLLAAWLLAEGERFKIVLPNTFISADEELKRVLMPLWELPSMVNAERHGCSFWLQMK